MGDDVFVAIATWDYCKVCGRYDDLRLGACYGCARNVFGEAVPGGHLLWIGHPDKTKAIKTWRVRNQ